MCCSCAAKVLPMCCSCAANVFLMSCYQCRRQGGLKGRGQTHVLMLSNLSGLLNGQRITQFPTWCGRGQKHARGQIFRRAALVVARCGTPRTEMGHFRWAGLPRRGTTCRCVCVCARARASMRACSSLSANYSSHVHTRTHMHICTHTHTHTHICAHTSRAHVRVRARTHTHTRTALAGEHDLMDTQGRSASATPQILHSVPVGRGHESGSHRHKVFRDLDRHNAVQ